MKLKHFYKYAVIALLLFACLSFTSCGKKHIDNKKFIAVYCDLSIAQDTLSFNEFQKSKKDILKKYEVTDKELKETYEYYYNNPELWEPFFKSASEKIEKIRTAKPGK